MRYLELLDRIRQGGGAPTRAKAERVLETTLSTLGAALSSDEVDAIAEHVPEEVAAMLRAPEKTELRDEGTLYERVRQRQATTLGRAVEQAQIAFRELGAMLPTDVRRRLERHLAPSIAVLLEPRDIDVEPPPVPPPHRPAPRRSLATGKPWSDHPVSESGPKVGQEGSVARAADPHESTKMSTAHGLRQEQDERTLATGRPGSRHPVSGG